MATWQLTPTTPNEFTGFSNSVLGWHLTLATALDVLTGCNKIFAAGWLTQLGPLATSPQGALPIWQLVITKGPLQIVINDTDWFAFDGQNVWAIPESIVQADYTVTAYTPPGG
jgi:hypothetical protein